MSLFMHNFLPKFYPPNLKMYVCMTSRIFFLSIGQFLRSHLLNFRCINRLFDSFAIIITGVNEFIVMTLLNQLYKIL